MKIAFWSYGRKVIRHISLMTLFFVLPSGFLGAQTFFFEKYGVEQGLSSSKVYSLLQDRNDWLWLGTESGVSRFSGSKFENFTLANGLAGGGVFSLAEDSLGRIWFGHLNGGLSIYDGRQFRKLKFDSISVSGDINSIKQIGSYIWITTFSNGAIRIPFPQPGDTVLTGKQYRGKEGLSDRLSSSYIGKDGSYYCVDPNFGIKIYDADKDQFQNFSLPGIPRYFAVITLFEDSRGDFWFGTYNGGLYRYNKSAGKMEIYDHRDGLAKNMVTFITEDYRGNIWAGTHGGGITVFPGDKMRTYDSSNGLDALNINWILEDKEKNMIIADRYTGISIYKGDHFVTFSDERILPDKGVFAVEEDESGQYWFGTNAGISVYNPGKKPGEQVRFFNNAKNAIGDKIRFIKSDKKGKIWIGTAGNGLSYYDLRSGRFVFDSWLNEKLDPYGIIQALETDQQNRLWIGNQDRLVVWDGSENEPLTYTQASGLAGTNIRVLFCDNKNNIWIGSENRSGLTKYDASTGKFKIINIGEGYVPVTINQTADSRIWVGTVDRSDPDP